MDFGRYFDGEKWVEIVAEMAQMTEPKEFQSSGADLQLGSLGPLHQCGQKRLPETLQGERTFMIPNDGRMLPKEILGAGSNSSHKVHIAREEFWVKTLAQL